MTTTEFALVARDGFFFKDGRGWATSGTRHAGSLRWPFPTTLLGALRAQVGRRREAVRGGAVFTRDEWADETAAVALGTTLPLRRVGIKPWSAEHRMWPVPADALHVKKGVVWLAPKRRPPGLHTLGLTDDPAREALWLPTHDGREKPAPSPQWWTEQQMTKWLAAHPATRAATDDELPAQGLDARMDIHLSIDRETLTASEGMLYAKDVVETRGRGGHEWAVAMQADVPDVDRGFEAGTWVLGGDARIAHAEAVDASVFEAPKGTADTHGLRLIAVTPAHFTGGWLPDGFAARGDHYVGALPGVVGELVLRAAMVPRPVHASGWDMQRGAPKRTLRMVPAGAVYYLQKMGDAAFTRDEMRALWLVALGLDTRCGLGRFIPGAWTPQETR